MELDQQEIELLVSEEGLVRLSTLREILYPDYTEWEDLVHQSLCLLKKLAEETRPNPSGKNIRAEIVYRDREPESDYYLFEFPFWFNEAVDLTAEARLQPLALRYTRTMKHLIEEIVEEAPGFPEDCPSAVVDAALYLFGQFTDGKRIGRKFFVCPFDSAGKNPIVFPFWPTSSP